MPKLIYIERNLPQPFAWIGRFLITWNWHGYRSIEIGYYPDYECPAWEITIHLRAWRCLLRGRHFWSGWYEWCDSWEERTCVTCGKVQQRQ